MPEKSKGHIGWTPDGKYEYWQTDGGEVYFAPVSNVFDLDNGNRFGRWESSIGHFERCHNLVDGVVHMAPPAYGAIPLQIQRS